MRREILTVSPRLSRALWGSLLVVGLPCVAIFAQEISPQSVFHDIIARQNEAKIDPNLRNALYFCWDGQAKIISASQTTVSQGEGSGANTNVNAEDDFTMHIKGAADSFGNAAAVLQSLVDEKYHFEISDEMGMNLKSLGYPDSSEELIVSVQKEAKALMELLISVVDGNNDVAFGRSIQQANSLSNVIAVIARINGVSQLK